MSKIFLFLLLIFSFSSVNAQWINDFVDVNGYLSVGYGYMSPSSKGLDDFTTNYNKQRESILSKRMETPSMSGMTYNTGIMVVGILLEFGYTSRKGTMTAEADPTKVTPGSALKREIELTHGGYNFTIGYLFGEGLLNFGPVFDLSINTIDFTTTNSFGKTSAYEIGTFVGYNLGGMLVLGNVANTGAFLTIRPYYSFTIREPNWRELYRVTSTNYPGPEYESSEGAFGGFNINATISLNIACF